MVERKEGNETVQSVEEARDKVGKTLDQVQRLGKIWFSDGLGLQTKVSCGDGAMHVSWESYEGLGKLNITLFVEGVKDPITLYLGEEDRDEVIFTEDVLGFNPNHTPFNYMIHPETTA